MEAFYSAVKLERRTHKCSKSTKNKENHLLSEDKALLRLICPQRTRRTGKVEVKGILDLSFTAH